MVTFCNGLTGIMRIYGNGIRNLSPVTTTLAIIYRRCLCHRWTTFKNKVANISANFRKNSKWPQKDTQGPGVTDSWKKTWSLKSRVRLPLRASRKGWENDVRGCQHGDRTLGKDIEELILRCLYARLLFVSFETSPIIWICKPALALHC